MYLLIEFNDEGKNEVICSVSDNDILEIDSVVENYGEIVYMKVKTITSGEIDCDKIRYIPFSLSENELKYMLEKIERG